MWAHFFGSIFNKSIRLLLGLTAQTSISKKIKTPQYNACWIKGSTSIAPFLDVPLIMFHPTFWSFFESWIFQQQGPRSKSPQAPTRPPVNSILLLWHSCNVEQGAQLHRACAASRIHGRSSHLKEEYLMKSQGVLISVNGFLAIIQVLNWNYFNC